MGNRTIYKVMDKGIVFGADGGAFVTDYREWFQYEQRVIDGLER